MTSGTIDLYDKTGISETFPIRENFILVLGNKK